MTQRFLSKPFFQQVAQQDLPIRQYTGKSPMFFTGAHMLGAVFPIDAAAAQVAMPIAGYRPITPFPGKALLGVLAFDYADTDLGPYREVFVTIPIVPLRTKAPSLRALLRQLTPRNPVGHTVLLPVDSEAALFGGLDYYNVPKVMSAIRFQEGKQESGCDVTGLDGKRIFAIQAKYARGSRLAAKLSGVQSFRNISLQAGRTIVARFDLRIGALGLAGPGSTRLTIGDHEHAEMLRRLSPGKALVSIAATDCDAILHEPMCGEADG
jgi:hypothetical protein